MRPRSGSWLSLTVIPATLAMAPALAPAQRVSGSLSVSATVLPPIVPQPAELISFAVERAGIARMETTVPVAGAVSLIVMPTVSSSANGFAPIQQAPALVRPTHRAELVDASSGPTESPTSRWHYQVELGPVAGRSEQPDDVSVRINYLIVPGT